MKNVLIVDDEKSLILSLKDGLEAYKDQFTVLTAGNGEEAVEIIESSNINLVITDLKMPGMNGLELLSYMSKNFPSLPFMVMTAYGTPKIEMMLKNMNMIKLIEKPLDLEELVQAITECLEDDGKEEGSLSGISLSSFLQLIKMEQKTCLLEIIYDGKKQGAIYCQYGELVDAVFGKTKGEEAVYKMLALEEVQMSFGSLPKKKIKKRIKTGLMGLIMNAMKIKDEKQGATEYVQSTTNELTDLSVKFEFTENFEDFDTTMTSPEEQELPAVTENRINIVKGDKKMALEKILEEVKTVKGYKASAIMNFTGEVLASDSNDQNIDLALVGATFNDIFRSAHEASDKIGLDSCHETTIETPKGVILMVCSGVNAKVHFHIIGVLSADGNQALMKMQMDKIIPAVLNELR